MIVYHESGANTVRSPEVVVAMGKNESDKAAEYKQRAIELLEPFLRLKDEAAREGFIIGWQAIAPDAFGRNQIIDLHLVKRF